jgi:tRNA nucleotidyltransferase (CCA-adding enzyme)
LYKEIFLEVEKVIGEVYMVGGSVRDVIMGICPQDYDFCTPLCPDEIEEKVRQAGKRPYLAGKRFGTVGFKLNGSIIEITTYRTEHYEKNSRKPKVDFVSDLCMDLERRDFTINAMAVRFHDGKEELVDPFGGQEDLKETVVRAVGNAEERIKEDPLRMLRAARFVSELGFDIDDVLFEAIKKKAKSIFLISKERWTAELDKLLTGENPGKGLQILADTELLRYIFPELWLQIGFDQDSPYHNLTLWEHTKKVVNMSQNNTETRWASLLHDIGKPFVKKKNSKGYSSYSMHDKVGAEMVHGIAYRMKWSKKREENVAQLILTHMNDDSPLRETDNRAKKW